MQCHWGPFYKSWMRAIAGATTWPANYSNGHTRDRQGRRPLSVDRMDCSPVLAAFGGGSAAEYRRPAKKKP